MKDKTTITFITVLIALACIFAVYGYAIGRIDELKKEITKKQELIDSQVRMIIDIKDHCEKCDCEWLQSFYDEFHEEVGAYE